MRLFRISPIAMGSLLLLASLNLLSLLWLKQVATQDGALRIAATEWAPGSSAATEHALPQPKDKTAYSEILARPIFYKDRRPFVPAPPAPPPRPVAVAPPPPAVDPRFSVMGIAITKEGRQAFVTSAANRDGAWFKEGEDVMGWQISRIISESVTLQKAGRSIELLLYDDDINK